MVGAVAAAVVVATWSFAPATVDRFEAWLFRRQQEAWIDGFRDAAGHADPVDRLQALDRLAERFPARGKLDRSYVLAQQVARQAVGLHLAAGDPVAAARHARRLLAMDPRNVADVALAVRALGASADTRGEAVDVLRATIAAVPAALEVVTAGVELLTAAGDLDGAVRLVVDAWRATPSNRWQVAWSDEAMEHAWFLPARLGADGIESRFRVDREVRWLRIESPEHAALAVSGAQLGVEAVDGTVRWFACDPETATADGAGSTSLRVELPEVSPRGAVFVFRATVRPVVARWLADLVQGPQGAALAAHATAAPGDAVCTAFLALREAAR